MCNYSHWQTNRQKYCKARLSLLFILRFSLSIVIFLLLRLVCSHIVFFFGSLFGLKTGHTTSAAILFSFPHMDFAIGIQYLNYLKYIFCYIQQFDNW